MVSHDMDLQARCTRFGYGNALRELVNAKDGKGLGILGTVETVGSAPTTNGPNGRRSRSERLTLELLESHYSAREEEGEGGGRRTGKRRQVSILGNTTTTAVDYPRRQPALLPPPRRRPLLSPFTISTPLLTYSPVHHILNTNCSNILPSESESLRLPIGRGPPPGYQRSPAAEGRRLPSRVLAVGCAFRRITSAQNR